MSEDWKAGDIAICVDAEPCRRNPSARLLKLGRHYRVAVAADPGDGVLSLAFRCLTPKPGFGYAYAANRFRRIEPAEDVFTEAMRNLLPVIPKLEPITVEIRMPNPEIWENLP